MTLYRYIPVWCHDSQGAKLYRCFEILGTGRYVVQSADYFTAATYRERTAQMDEQFVDLLLEQRPEERSAPGASIDEAIQIFDAAFHR